MAWHGTSRPLTGRHLSAGARCTSSPKPTPGSCMTSDSTWLRTCNSTQVIDATASQSKSTQIRANPRKS